MSKSKIQNIGFNKILVIEDEPGLAQVLKLILKSAGYSVSLMTRGDLGLKAALNDHAIELVITDVRLPGLDGIELLKKLQKKRPAITVIVMSAYSSIELAVEAMKHGAYHFISKPFKKDLLLHTVQQAAERKTLIDENTKLKKQLEVQDPQRKIMGNSQVIENIFKQISKISKFKSTVLITGESGTGKELVARSVHKESPYDGKFVAINCGAIPENLLESELFGHVKGAFTGAVKDKKGLFLEANGGTIFLDEIGELPMSIQVKLLRVLQENRLRAVGSNSEIEIDLRIIAATAKNLKKEVADGKFREDLFYRLDVVPIILPPLRERGDDIVLLANYFLERSIKKFRIKSKTISKSVLEILQSYPWPGNIRELENLMERLVILSEDSIIVEKDLPYQFFSENDPLSIAQYGEELSIKKATRALERMLIKKALIKSGGKKGVAADLLELSKRALLYKIKEYNILA
jgi:two-component system, NtrC family, response regulator AtoC